jgi:hypothetical protein
VGRRATRAQPRLTGCGGAGRSDNFHAMDDEQITRELQAAQLKREADERRSAEASIDPDESAQHERRADKARYLRSKLDERAESERDSDS